MTRDCFQSAVHRMRTEERRTQAGQCACDMQMHAAVCYERIHKFVWEKRFSVRRMIHSYKWQYMHCACSMANKLQEANGTRLSTLFISFFSTKFAFFGIFSRFENLTQGSRAEIFVGTPMTNIPKRTENRPSK